MDVLVALGTTSAFVFSLLTMFLEGDSHLYFEASAVIITLVLFGKWLEERAKRGASQSIRLLMGLRPEIAHLKRGDDILDIPAEDVMTGDTLVIKPGERFPVDGTVTSGQSEADVSHITGESLPVLLAVNDTAYGGALNGTGAIELKATTEFSSSTLGRIIELVESAQSGKAPIQRLVDKISSIFVRAVVTLSLVTLVGWLALGASFEQALLPAIAVLVIACPCALGLATPTALVAGLGAAAKSGILIRDIETLERAEGLSIVAFDKTGTLTLGKPEVTSIEAEDETEVLRLAASVQGRSEHLLARALLSEAEMRGIELETAEGFENFVGEGIAANVSNSTIFVGNKELMARSGILDVGPAPHSEGVTSIFVSKDGSLLGRIDLRDQLRDTSRAAIAALRSAGLRTALLSGDAKSTTETIGEDVGIDEALGGLKPDDKLTWIKNQQSTGQIVAMVGDGVNDAPALAIADMGIAMGQGTDIAMATAGITLMQEDPRLVSAALDIAKATRRKIRQNLGWAFVYNVIGLPLATLGMLAPTFAAAAMALSSVSVVTNSLLLRYWQAKRG